MNLFEEISEVSQKKEHLKEITDQILDCYTEYPEQCRELLFELQDIEKDLDILETEFWRLQNEIY